LLQVKAEQVVNVCNNEPIISYKFNRLLCSKLSDRFKNTSPPPQVEDNVTDEDIVTELFRKFRMTEGVLIDKTTATYKSDGRGRLEELYLFSTAICFSSKEFGSNQRLKFILGEIEDIVDKETRFEITYRDTAYIFSKVSNADVFIPNVTKIFRSSSTPIQLEEENIVENENDDEQDTMLPTEDDWTLIISGTNTLTYPKDKYLIRQGEVKRPRLYQVVEGSCRIEKVLETGEVLHLATLTTEDPIFGEISFLEGTEGRGTASVRSDEDNTSIRILDGNYLDILFEYYPDLAGRYYYYLAVIISTRLKKRHDANMQRIVKPETKIDKKKRNQKKSPYRKRKIRRS